MKWLACVGVYTTVWLAELFGLKANWTFHLMKFPVSVYGSHVSSRFICCVRWNSHDSWECLSSAHLQLKYPSFHLNYHYCSIQHVSVYLFGVIYIITVWNNNNSRRKQSQSNPITSALRSEPSAHSAPLYRCMKTQFWSLSYILNRSWPQ